MNLFTTYYQSWFSPDRHFFNAMRNMLGFTPKNLALYKLAFSHRSESSTSLNGLQLSNERLEYLGDAVLGAIVAKLLFRRFPFRDEGFLTEMRSRIVSRETLKSLALKIGLDRYMPPIQNPGAFRSMYGDAFEALVGAAFLDRGYRYAERFVVERIINLHLDLAEVEKSDTNFKSRIINWGQREKRTVVFETVEEGNGRSLSRVRLLVDGKEIASGADMVKKKAEQTAAQKACELLNIKSED